MDRQNILRKVLAKLDLEKKLNEDKTEELIFDNFVDRQEAVNDNYSKKIKLDDKKHDLLRRVYDYGAVEQLYTYGSQKFGFRFSDMRFEANSGYLEIKKIKG